MFKTLSEAVEFKLRIRMCPRSDGTPILCQTLEEAVRETIAEVKKYKPYPHQVEEKRGILAGLKECLAKLEKGEKL